MIAKPARRLTDEEREAHYVEYEPGTPVVQETPMSRDLAGPEAMPPIRRLEHELGVLRAEQGATRAEVASLLTSRAAQRKLMWLVIPALATGLVTALVYAGDKIAASAERVGKTEAKLESYKERLDNQEAEIGQLRAALLRLTGSDHSKSITIARHP